MKKTLIALAGIAALGAGTATAQEMRPTLTLESAQTIRDTCLAYAAENDMVIAIAIYNEGGMLMTYAAMDGIAPAIPEVAQWKGKSAATYRYATSETENWGGEAPGIAVWEGGLPIFTPDGAPLGGGGVSGAESADDVACLSAGIEAAGLVSQASE